jgi:hypothetical protein
MVEGKEPPAAKMRPNFALPRLRLALPHASDGDPQLPQLVLLDQVPQVLPVLPVPQGLPVLLVVLLLPLVHWVLLQQL